MIKSLTRSPWPLLILIILVGAWFRLVNLGDAALRSDTITFWRICTSGLSAGEIFEQWISLGHTGHFPFANAFIRWFNDTLGLEVTHFTLRLPSAIWGILTIPVAFLLGRTFGSWKFGLFFALFVAVNPYHIQTTREAYFYPPMVLGSFGVTWALIEAVERVRKGLAPGKLRTGVFFAGSFLMIYSVPAGWLLYLVGIGILVGYAIRFKNLEGGASVKLLKTIGILLLLVIPFLTVSWGFSQFSEHVGDGSVKEAGGKAAAHMTDHAGTLIATFITRFAFGNTPLRIASMAIVVLAGLIWLYRQRKTTHAPFVLGITVVSVFVLFLFVRGQVNMLFEPRYVIALMPAYLLLLALGAWNLGEVVAAKVPALASRKTAVRIAACVGVIVLVLPGSYYSTQMNGQPAPYKEIQKWVDSELPKGTLILVDRWFEPWNELAVYPSTNAFYTYTIPNEPLEVFEKYNWRSTAQQFFARYPGAAYLEINRSYWEVPSVGPWLWPRSYFSQRKVFENKGGLELRKTGLAARPDFYAPATNKTVVELFYNTREDIVTKARNAGRPILVFFGEEWGYQKMRQDHSAWHIMMEEGTIEIMNLRDEPMDMVMQIAATSINQPKTIALMNGQTITFQPQKPMSYSLELPQVPPGSTHIRFTDKTASRGEPLLVNAVMVQPKKGG